MAKAHGTDNKSITCCHFDIIINKPNWFFIQIWIAFTFVNWRLFKFVDSSSHFPHYVLWFYRKGLLNIFDRRALSNLFNNWIVVLHAKFREEQETKRHTSNSKCKPLIQNNVKIWFPHDLKRKQTLKTKVKSCQILKTKSLAILVWQPCVLFSGQLVSHSK